ncbi:jg15306 [Pararge aegeria aegeria]|uniref:Jg15306 protein n=1 Tax=Pararge aegeria aegeria TaxID=348720 RepID=A0A8S4RAD9_9NEOP|nr:jg15306 [Pararge aegeria aegeria]
MQYPYRVNPLPSKTASSRTSRRHSEVYRCITTRRRTGIDMLRRDEPKQVMQIVAQIFVGTRALRLMYQAEDPPHCRSIAYKKSHMTFTCPTKYCPVSIILIRAFN